MFPWNSLSFAGLQISSTFHDKIFLAEYKGIGHSLCSPLDMLSFSALSLCAGEPYPELENSREGDPTQGWQGIQSHMPLSLPRATIRGELTNKLRVSGGFAFLRILPLFGLKILLFKETGLQRARDLGTPEPNSYPGLKQHDLGKKVIKNTNKHTFPLPPSIPLETGNPARSYLL